MSKALAIALLLGVATVGPTRVEAQGAGPSWHLEAGRASLHEVDRRGYIGMVGATWTAFDRRTVRLGVFGAGSSADENYLSLLGRAELHPVPEMPVSPFLGAEGGLLAEPEFGGLAGVFLVGVLVRPAAALGLRVTAGWGTHGGTMGPRFVSAGIEIG